MVRPTKGVVIFAIVLFGVLGLALLGLGWWGVRTGFRHGKIPKMTRHQRERREVGLRWGAYGCLVVGGLFVVAAAISILGGPPPPAPR